MLNKEPIACVSIILPLLTPLYGELLITGEQVLIDVFEYCGRGGEVHYQQAAIVLRPEDSGSELVECLHVITDWCSLRSWCERMRRSVWFEADSFFSQLSFSLLQLLDLVRIEDQMYLA